MKATILLVMQSFCIVSLSAQVQGPRSPQAFSNQDITGYNQQWTNISDAAVSDNKYASFGDLSGGTGSYTDYLVATKFGFSIPDGTIITGIKVEVECSDPNEHTADYSVRLVTQGVVDGLDKATGAAYPITDAFMVYGGANDLWGATWTSGMINDVEFGVAIAAQNTMDDGVATAGQVNSIRITVYFNYTTLPVSLTSFTATKAANTVRLNWKTSSESNMDHYQVERSSNGTNFTPIAIVQSQNSPGAEYFHIDNNPLQGISYYRLNMKELTGAQKYSPVVTVSFGRENTAFLYPSPWDKGATLNISNLNNAKLTIYFINASGQVLSTAVTETGIVPTGALMSRKGMIYYKVFDQAKNQIGAGSLLVL